MKHFQQITYRLIFLVKNVNLVVYDTIVRVIDVLFKCTLVRFQIYAVISDLILTSFSQC